MKTLARLSAALLLIGGVASADCIDVGANQVVVVRIDHNRVVADRFGVESERPLDAEPVLVSAIKQRQTSPAIAFDGKRHLIVWLLDGDVVGRFLSPDGDVDRTLIRFTASTAADRVAVAWLGNAYLVAWNGPHSSSSMIDDRGGSMTVLPLFGGDVVSGEIAIAPGDDRALVAYSVKESIRTVRLQHHDTRGRAEIRATPTRGELRLVGAPWGYVLAWPDDHRIVAQKLDRDGSPVGRPRLVDGTNPKFHDSFVALTYDGDTPPVVVVGNSSSLSAGRIFETSFDDPSITAGPITKEKESGCESPMSAVPLHTGVLATVCGTLRFFGGPVLIVQ